MTASSLEGPYLEFARCMEIPSIPERLRCATCDKLAVNAVKLPCCDNTICDKCHDDLTATECPLCMHSPFAADMCVPAKALQTTVKVFIKNEAKKRGIDLKTGAKIVLEPPVPVVTEPTDTVVAAAPALDTPAEESMLPNAVVPETPIVNGVSAVEGGAVPGAEAQTDIDQTNGEADEQTGDQDQEDEDDEDDEFDEDDVVITTERPEVEPQQHQEAETQEHENAPPGPGNETSDQHMQTNNQQQGFGFDQNMSGFGNGGFDMNNMNTMNTMSNTNNMNNMNMNGFMPMMGMPGLGMGMGMQNMMMPNMGMDPSMMFTGNFGGMGDMSMMGMGMGMGNMGGGMSGMGDFNGMGGPGFFPNHGNYMQSNYGNAHRQNFLNDRGYSRGGRGFGRGPRGNQNGRGRGGWGIQQQQQQYGQNQQFVQSQAGGPQQSGANSTDVENRRRASPSYETGKGTDGTLAASSNDESMNAETNGENKENNPDTDTADNGTNGAAGRTNPIRENGDITIIKDHANDGTDHKASADNCGIQKEGADNHSEAHNEISNDVQYAQQSNYGDNQWGGQGGYRGGRGGYGLSRGEDSITELTSMPAPAPPINAPTGPKAMRQGLPNTGWAGRTFTQPAPTPTPAPDVNALSQPAEPVAKDGRDKVDDCGRTRSPSRPKHRSSKDAERGDEYESDRTHAQRKERERRKRKEREEREEREERHNEERFGGKDDKSSKKYRSRSESRTDDSSRRHHREKDDEYRSSRSHRDRSKDRHRRRHRSRSPGKDETQDDHSRRKTKSHHERDGEYEESDRYRESRRSRKHSSRDEDDHKDDRKDRAYRSSKHERSSKGEGRARESERPRAVIEPPSDQFGFKIKGSKFAKAKKDTMAPPTLASRDRRSSVLDSTFSTPVDPYAEERARAQQNRVAREAERRMSSSTTLGKRGRGEEEDADIPRGPKGDHSKVKKGRKERRVNYKYEDEVAGEDERDSGRWR